MSDDYPYMADDIIHVTERNIPAYRSAKQFEEIRSCEIVCNALRQLPRFVVTPEDLSVFTLHHQPQSIYRRLPVDSCWVEWYDLERADVDPRLGFFLNKSRTKPNMATVSMYDVREDIPKDDPTYAYWDSFIFDADLSGDTVLCSPADDCKNAPSVSRCERMSLFVEQFLQMVNSSEYTVCELIDPFAGMSRLKRDLAKKKAPKFSISRIKLRHGIEQTRYMLRNSDPARAGLMPLHGVRGHTRTYRRGTAEERVVWIKPQQRGKKENGVRVSYYDVLGHPKPEGA